MIDAKRRRLLTAAPSMLLLGACSLRTESATAWFYNPDNLAGLVEKYVKVIGALDKRQVYLQYYGQIIAITPGESGEVLTEYKNPFTGETNEPLHYNSGEIKETIGLGDDQTNPADFDWRVTGNQLSISNSRVGRRRSSITLMISIHIFLPKLRLENLVF